MIGVSDNAGGQKSVMMVDCSKDQKKILNETKEEETSKSDSLADVDITTVGESPSGESSTITTTVVATKKETVDITSSSTSTTVTETTTQVKRSLESTDQDKVENNESSSKRVKLETVSSQTCKLDLQPKDAYPDQEVNLFATEGWRDLLCQCSSCLALYTKEDVSFILGEEAIYEDDDDDDAESSILESGMKKLSEMDRVQMMDGMLAYNRMRDEIRSFLAPFSEQGKVVTEEDVRAFFTVSHWLSILVCVWGRTRKSINFAYCLFLSHRPKRSNEPPLVANPTFFKCG